MDIFGVPIDFSEEQFGALQDGEVSSLCVCLRLRPLHLLKLLFRKVYGKTIEQFPMFR